MCFLNFKTEHQSLKLKKYRERFGQVDDGMIMLIGQVTNKVASLIFILSNLN